jgi:SecD/SecF fusion protein
MIDELQLLKDMRPDVPPVSPETRQTARRALERAIVRDRPRMRRWITAWPVVRPSRLAPVAGILVVVAIVAVFLGVRGGSHPVPAAGGVELVFRAEPSRQASVVTPAAIARTIEIMRQRIAPVVPGVTVSSTGDEIFVRVPGSTRSSEAQLLALVAPGGRLAFYDWEANALTPSGKPVASLLHTQDHNVLVLSQGGGSASPGSPGAGSMSLYAAAKLASQQPMRALSDNSRGGPEYFAFAAPGSAACTSAARFYHVTPVIGQRCYLAGPADNVSDLDAVLPKGVSASQAQVLVVKRGTVILQAVPSNYTHAPKWSDPNAQFYVLRDNVSVSGTDITNPQQSTDQSGSPDVTFGFTSKGGAAFGSVTAQIAHRGALVSGFGSQYNQHFAVALDTQLITVPSIDYKTYPDGIQGNNGADITGGFSKNSARQLARELQLGAYPVDLRLLSERRSA